MRRQQGIAMIMVLWLTVLLGIMAAGHARNTHSDTRLAALQLDSAQARALAEGGVWLAIADLLDATGRPVPAVDGTRYEINLGAERITVAIRDVRGLVDLNAAGPAILATALDAGGVGEPQRSQIIDAILDWRDGDDLAHLNGAERDDYRTAGLAWTPRNAAFDSVDELKYVLGMNRELFNRIAPLLTVHSGSPGLDPRFAPLALAAATGATGQKLSAAPIHSGRLQTGTYLIQASAAGNAGAIATVETTVRLSTSRSIPYAILEWRDVSRGTVIADDRWRQ